MSNVPRVLTFLATMALLCAAVDFTLHVIALRGHA
jgi:preprotein translocase subunit SecE